MTRIEQQLREIAIVKLIDIEADKIKGKHKEEFKKHAQTVFNSLQTKNYYEQWRIFCFSFNSFHNRHRPRCILGFVITSLAIAFFDKAITSQIGMIRIFSFLVFCYSLVIYVVLFNIWYSDDQSNFSSIRKRLKKVDRKVNSLNFNIWSNFDKIVDKITEEIIVDEISSLQDKWRQIGYISFLSAPFISLIYMLVIGDSLNDNIIWTASFIGFGDFEPVKNLTTQTIVFSMFPFQVALLALVLVLSLDKRREYLKDSLERMKKKSSKRSLFAKILKYLANFRISN